MADGDVILQIPNAFLEFNAGDNEDLAPIVDTDQTGRLGIPFPPNHGNGNPVRWPINKVLPKNARVYIGSNEQTVTDDTDLSYLEFTANLTGLSIGEYNYAISENPDGESFSATDMGLHWCAQERSVNVAQSEITDYWQLSARPTLNVSMSRALNTGAGDIEFLTNEVYPGTTVSLEATPDTGVLQYPIISKLSLSTLAGACQTVGGFSFMQRYYRKSTYTGDANSIYKCILYCGNGNESDDPLWALIFFEADFYLTFRHFTAANAATWTDYATTIPIPADQWTTLIVQVDDTNDRLWVGCNGQQQSFAFTPSDWTTANYFYHGGPWGSFNFNLDDGAFWDAYYSETLLVRTKQIFGDKPTYFEPTEVVIPGAWYFAGPAPISSPNAGFGSVAGVPNNCFFTNWNASLSYSGTYNGTAWASETNISGTLTYNGTFQGGVAGNATDNLQFGTWLLGTASWNGTAWTSEANHIFSRDSCGGAGNLESWEDGEAFVTGTATSGQTSHVEYYNGTSWSAGASTDTNSEDSACGGSYSSAGAIAINDSTANQGSVYEGAGWSALPSAPFATSGVAMGGFGKYTQFIAHNANASTTRYNPVTFTGTAWSAMETMPFGGYGASGCGDGSSTECLMPMTASGLYDYQFMVAYNPQYSRDGDIQGWWR